MQDYRFNPVASEMATVIDWIRETCDKINVTVKISRRDYRILDVQGEFSAESGYPEIDLSYRLDCTPQRLWWSFLHEVGHMMQWQDYGTDWDTFHTYYMYRTVPLERDAWMRAERLAVGSLYPPCEAFQVFARECLNTYEKPSSTVLFVLMG